MRGRTTKPNAIRLGFGRRMAALLVVVLLGVGMAATRPTLKVHGHRGARAVMPENTIPAFEYAAAAGADFLELDLAVTRDDVLVVSHDPHLSEPVCTGPRNNVAIRELTLAEVMRYDCGATANPGFPRQKAVPGTKMPTLDEVLALASNGRFEFNIETKIFPDRPALSPAPERFAELVLAAVRKRNLVDRVILQSFDFRTLRAMKRLEPAMRRSALYLGPPRDWVAMAREAEATIVSPYHLLVTPDRVRDAHAAGLQVVPWTANDPAHWERLAAAGVDAIISDDPKGLVEWLRARP